MKVDHLDDSEFVSLVHVEGCVLRVSEKRVFYELLVKDTASGIEIPVITFEAIDTNLRSVMCIGTVHYNWKPDLRCSDVFYPVALKADIIKHK